jgi:hypothetical protein
MPTLGHDWSLGSSFFGRIVTAFISLRQWSGFTHSEVVVFHRPAVEDIYGFLWTDNLGQLHEGETSRISRIEIANYLYRLDLESMLFNPSLKFLFCSQMRKLANIESGHDLLYLVV